KTSHVGASLGEGHIGSEPWSVKRLERAFLSRSLALRLQVLRDQIDQLRRECQQLLRRVSVLAELLVEGPGENPRAGRAIDTGDGRAGGAGAGGRSIR